MNSVPEEMQRDYEKELSQLLAASEFSTNSRPILPTGSMHPTFSASAGFPKSPPPLDPINPRTFNSSVFWEGSQRDVVGRGYSVPASDPFSRFLDSKATDLAVDALNTIVPGISTAHKVLSTTDAFKNAKERAERLGQTDRTSDWGQSYCAPLAVGAEMLFTETARGATHLMTTATCAALPVACPSVVVADGAVSEFLSGGIGDVLGTQAQKQCYRMTTPQATPAVTPWMPPGSGVLRPGYSASGTPATPVFNVDELIFGKLSAPKPPLRN